METKDRIIRARVQIQKDNPFFAYLSLYLKFKEDTKNQIPETSLGAGVSADGEFIYKNEFIERLTEPELNGVIIHEILHLSLLHLTRRQSREMEFWNIACDIAVNQIIKDNGIELPRGAFKSDSANSIKVGGVILKNVDKKSAEQIYDELYKAFLLKDGEGGEGDGNGKGEIGKGEGRFDKHIEGKNKTQKERKEQEDYWLDKISEAYVTAKMKGSVPLGLEVLIGKLHKEQINWRALLYRYITQSIPYDYTYAKPNKKSISTGFYMPDITKDKIKVLIGIDLSGSIGYDELADFLSEIIGMAKTFREKITFRLLTHDVDVQNDYLIENGNIEKIKKLSLKGGGGTSHKPILKYINDKYKDTQLAIFLTDACSDLQEIKLNDYKFQKLFVISKCANEMDLSYLIKQHSKILQLK